jgi:mercuric ion transport protein
MEIDSPKALAIAAFAGIAASLCCAGPLVLVTLGVSGAWISNLTALEPYRWLFAALALGATGYAWRQIYRAPGAAQCAPGAACALPQPHRAYRALFWVVAALVLAGLSFPYFAPFFY